MEKRMQFLEEVDCWDSVAEAEASAAGGRNPWEIGGLNRDCDDNEI